MDKDTSQQTGFSQSLIHLLHLRGTSGSSYPIPGAELALALGAEEGFEDP